MSDQPTPNVPLLRKAVEWVEEQDKLPAIDKQWYQGSWQLSAACKALMLAADNVQIWDPSTGGSQTREYQALKAHCGTAYCVAGYVGMISDERYVDTAHPEGLPSVSEFARNELGLTRAQSEVLFNGLNTAEDIRRIAEEYAGERL